MLGIVKAKGAVLTDEEGKEYIDAIASWYTAMYGHCHPVITKAVSEQMKKLDQVVFSGFTHQPAIELSESLMSVLPYNQQKLFFSDNGSTATEIGIKMALQYFHNLGEKRNVMLAFEEGFHGDTFGAMSVSGLSAYNGPFEEHFIRVERIPVPNDDNVEEVLESVEKRLKKKDIAGFIYEPLVQGAAAMKMHRPEHLCRILRLMKLEGVITIADEVMTGFGKTGTCFASEQVTVKPEIICLSKALTAGLLPMAITSCSKKVYDAFYDDAVHKGFFHGHTYTANPLACTAALAALELFRSDEMQGNIKRIIRRHKEFDCRIKDHPRVASTRQTGVIYAIDLTLNTDRYGSLRDRLYSYFMDQGIFLRPLGNTIYLLPPYVISDTELDRVYRAIEGCLELDL
ncbi:adenosylmethionine--8-amino-7-oxononanoate aminotransferase BioA [Muriicola marianensis]|uniref:Adenosylmethionine-8-amino-7-oxononanoate aminotransferase n=2 Tax=Muriicola marianensis TaxID=1324801 RepID=A0ABQ1QYS9_9FLAO|nr:adenosylmethionine--8-amino-7-oxononanoate aminotransferase BioA [Muriicola marianensis]